MHRYTILAAAAALALTTPGFGVELKPGVPIYVSSSEPAPVHRAVKDLQRDLRNVLGVDSPVVASVDAPAGKPGIVVLGPASPSPLRNAAVTGREAHAVFVRGSHVVLQGADMRGAIYAIYTFSERCLGVPPLWLWASWQPVRKASIDVAANTNIVFGPAYVRWRAWFPNDEDLLTPWRMRSQENFEAHLETMLRLKMNTLEGGMMDGAAFDEPYRIGRLATLARDRGLALTGHHMYIFGSSYAHWDAYWTRIRKTKPPEITIANVAALEEFWRYHVEAGVKAKLEMLWLVAFRGNRDIPFWKFFPDAPATDAERGRVIQTMIERQVALLKRTTGEREPVMRATLYDENSDLFAAGHLKLPDEPSLIRTFVAARRDHYPAPDVRNYRNDARRPIGYYMNFQFTSSGAHLAQAEGPWKMERNFRMVNAISGRPLEFSVVNAGNIREFVLELSANARMMWDFEGFRADAFLDDFCAQYFGAANAKAAAQLYRDFFHAYWTPKKPDIEGFDRQYLFQDMRYARAMEMMLDQMPKGREENPLTDRNMDTGGRYFRVVPQDNGVKTQLEAVAKATASSAAAFERVATAAAALGENLPPGNRTFFRDNLVTQARFMTHLNRALAATTAALNTLPDRTRALAELRKAKTEVDAFQAALKQAEHDGFAGWYNGDRVFGIVKLRERIDRTIAALSK